MLSITPVQSNAVFSPMYRGAQTNSADSKVPSKKILNSTVNHAIQSTPMLLSLTGILSLLDYGKGKMPLPDALKSNLTKFFAPVLIGSSIMLALIENSKLPKKSDKKMENTVV